jgi:hypothetical protein
LLTQFAGDRDLSPDDLRKLRRLIDRRLEDEE